MLSHTTRDILGRAAYLVRSCDLLVTQLREVDEMVSGTEALTPIQEAEVSKASVHHAERAAEHLDLVGQFIADWKCALRQALTLEQR